MNRSAVSTANLRFGDWGPGYLWQEPRSHIGVCLLRPADIFANHYHARHEETFLVLEGKVTLWVNCQDRYLLQTGDLFRLDPGELHYLSNDGELPCRLVFIKAPGVPGDKIDVPWQPGEPFPSEALINVEDS